MKTKFVMTLALLTAFAVPAFADSNPHAPTAHMRPQLFHDRSPHIHNRGSQPHHQA